MNFFCIRSEGKLNPRAKRADHLVINAVAVKHSCPFLFSLFLVLGFQFSFPLFFDCVEFVVWIVWVLIVCFMKFGIV